MSAQLDIFDLPLGRQRRDAGMKSAADHAGDFWRERYRAAVSAAFNAHPIGSSFTSEWLRLAARAAGVCDPPHFNAWSAMAGALLRAWLRSGQIVIAGEGQASGPQAHATRTVIYQKVRGT